MECVTLHSAWCYRPRRRRLLCLQTAALLTVLTVCTRLWPSQHSEVQAGPGQPDSPKVVLPRSAYYRNVNNRRNGELDGNYKHSTVRANRSRIQEMRRQNVRRICGASHRALKKSALSSLLVDDCHRIIYCVVPKVACTNMKRILLQLAVSGSNSEQLDEPVDVRYVDVHNDTQLARLGLRYLHTYTLPEVQTRLRNYFKFMFVREPYERLLSAYRDKFEKPQNKWNKFFHYTYGRDIIKLYRDNPDRHSILNGNDVKLSEFLKYVIQENSAGHIPDSHWARTSDLCQPCAIKYDFIGKYETLSDDTASLIDIISKDGEIQKFPHSTNKGASTYTLMEPYYRKVSHTIIAILQNVFRHDFVMYGYHAESLLERLTL